MAPASTWQRSRAASRFVVCLRSSPACQAVSLAPALPLLPCAARCPQAESFRTLAQQSEEKRARAEDELLTTARLAAALEARLAAAARDNEELRLQLEARRGAGVEGAAVAGALPCKLGAAAFWPSPLLWVHASCCLLPAARPPLTAAYPRAGCCLQGGEARVLAAQQSVGRLVEERWAAAGADRSRWPLAVQVRVYAAVQGPTVCLAFLLCCRSWPQT